MGEETGKAGTARDSKGRNHYIIYQTYGTTCGPASMAMLEYYYKAVQSCSKESQEERVREISAWREGEGMSFGTIPDTLEKMGIPSLFIRINPKKEDIYEKLKSYVTPKTPAIVELDHSWQAMGHVALCRSIDPDGIGVFLDPAFGVVESKKRNLPLFRFVTTGKLLFGGGLIFSLPKQ